MKPKLDVELLAALHQELIDRSYEIGFDDGYAEAGRDYGNHFYEPPFCGDQHAINGEFDIDLVRDSGDETK